MNSRIALAVGAHPDDIEFYMAGTLCLLRQAGYEVHYLNVCNGSCGGVELNAKRLAAVREKEARQASRVLGAVFHESRQNDLEVLYTLPLLRWLTATVRKIRPSIVLTHSPQDYMEDHVNVCRLVVSAVFARGMPNFRTTPPSKPIPGDATLYHAMPHGLCDGLRRRVVPGAYVDTSSVHELKLAALACHRSQQGWLKTSQGMNSYLRQMQEFSRVLGKESKRFRFAEGWRRHSHIGFCAASDDPLRDALGRRYRLNRTYERGLLRVT